MPPPGTGIRQATTPARLTHTASNEHTFAKSQTKMVPKPPSGITGCRSSMKATSPHVSTRYDNQARTYPSPERQPILHHSSENCYHHHIRWQEIADDPEMSKYTSSCTTAKEATSTALLVSITNNYTNLQRVERPINNLAVSFAGRWNICPDRFCGLKFCMVGVFTNVLPDGVNWSKSAAILAQEVDRQAVIPGTL